MENKQAAAADDQKLQENRLSALPDELIHHILAHLQSPKQAVKLLTLLSNRWIEIWRSYPIFEIEQDYPYRRTRFTAAVMEKFSQQQGSIAMAAVRVKIHRHADFCPDFLDPVFDLADKFSPPELDITFGKHHGTGYEIWGLRRQHFNKLIAETKSLESVTLINACEIGELKIASKELLGRLG
ncbi:hypothetical protein LINPERHAP1_LOCUS37282 [Linum perenne]